MTMPMSDQEIERLRKRLAELDQRIIPQLESRTQSLFMQIMPLQEGSEEREKLVEEYNRDSKELRLRSDERLEISRQIQRLQQQTQTRR